MLMVPVVASVAASTGNASDLLVLLAVAGVASGLVMIVAGRFRLGGAVRYLPTTVVGAFMAGTGWFLAKGGLAVMIGSDPGLGDVASLFGALLKFWFPGFVLAVALLMIARFRSLPAESPSVVIVASAALFYAWTGVTGSMETVGDDGWLIGPFPSTATVEPLRPQEISEFDFGLLLDNIGSLAAVVAVSVVALLLNVSGLEFVSRESFDQNRELRLTGVGNIVTAPLGALVGYVALGSSLLARRLGSKSRTIPFMAAAIMAVLGIFGPQLIGFVPRFIAGGLLMAVGIDLMIERLAQLKNSAEWSDRILTSIIVISMATIGILEGLVVGVVIACAIFVVRYSHIDPVYRESRGFHSSQVYWSGAESKVIEDHAAETHVYELQGYLFFGSTVGLADKVQVRCDSEDPLSAVVLDFHRVTGVDSSGYAVLARIHDVVTKTNARLVLSRMSSSLREGLERSNPELVAESIVRPDLDEALEWTETETLRVHGGDVVDLDELEASKQLSDSLGAWFTPVSFAPGDVLLEQGHVGDTLLFVVAGSVAAVRLSDDGSRRRLRQYRAGTWLGEVAFFPGGRRSAEVVATTHVDALQLTRTDYDEMRATEPAGALELHDRVMAAQAERSISLSIDLTRSLS